ncbi:hypothetical protein I5588_30360 [Burkholderia multivorans]|uniref:hypothetical protein n=1 Tax=Burkholderia multivorans TaxID=87883 RepID=UPI001903D418|nr:hypothetical protein [Burkholderia multivorans]MBJ9658827.1 hypothetical protein [Burkholderia multivorans]
MNPIIVLQHNGWSYIKHGYQLSYTTASALIINGQAGVAVECPGRRGYSMFEGELLTLAIPQAPTSNLIGYRIRDEYRDTTTFPRTLEADAFELDDDQDEYVPRDGAAYKREFYDEVRETVERESLLIDFIIVDRDCAPVERPGDITIDFPADLREHPETWHKHPVSISGKALFLRATAMLRAEVKAHPNEFAMTDYANIGTFTLMRVVTHKPMQYSYSIGKRTKRSTKTQSTVELMKISAPDSSYRDGAIVPGELRGANWADLEPQIERFLDTIRAFIAPGAVHICPHCDGDGFLVEARA